VVALAGAFPGAALGNDAGVLRAWQSNDRAFTATGAQVRLATVTFERTGQPGPLLTLFARTQTLIVRTRRAMVAQHASTPTGSTARAAALSSLSLFGRSIATQRAATLATARGQRALGVRLADHADDLLDLSDTAAARAITLFRRLGLKAGPVGAEE
jgi:hypothetical protein